MATEAQRKAKKKWNEAHRKQGNIYTYRSKAKKFVKDYANYKDLNQLKKLIKERENTMSKQAQQLANKINDDIKYFNDDNLAINAYSREELIDIIKDSISSLKTDDEEGAIGIILDPSDIEDYQELLEDVENSNNQVFFILSQYGLADTVCFDMIDLENAAEHLNIAEKKTASEIINIINTDLN